MAKGNGKASQVTKKWVDISSPEYSWCTLCRKGEHDACNEFSSSAILSFCMCYREDHEEKF